MMRYDPRERVLWQYELLKACTSSEEVLALPIQDRRSQVISMLRATLAYYRKIAQSDCVLATHQLCLIVERSTAVNDARRYLLERLSTDSSKQYEPRTCNTGVTEDQLQALAEYVSGGK